MEAELDLIALGTVPEDSILKQALVRDMGEQFLADSEINSSEVYVFR